MKHRHIARMSKQKYPGPEMNAVAQSKPPNLGSLITTATSLALEKLLPYGAITFPVTAVINPNTPAFHPASGFSGLVYAAAASVSASPRLVVYVESSNANQAGTLIRHGITGFNSRRKDLSLLQK